MYRYFKMRTLKVILVIDIFLGLAVESQEAISSLGVLNSDIEEYLDLIEMHLIEREWVEVFVVDVDESVVFAVSHQIADVYDQSSQIGDSELIKC